MANREVLIPGSTEVRSQPTLSELMASSSSVLERLVLWVWYRWRNVSL